MTGLGVVVGFLLVHVIWLERRVVRLRVHLQQLEQAEKERQRRESNVVPLRRARVGGYDNPHWYVD